MTLLLVDDDIEVVEMLKSLLDWSELGYTRILTAAGGPEAVAAAADQLVDLLISDIGMPVMDGYELSLRLKKQNPAMIVIFLTCHEDFDHAKQAICVGADDYLLKYALTGKTLRETVQRAEEKLRSSSSPAALESRYAAALDESRVSFKEQLLYRIVTGAIEHLDTVNDKMDLYQVRRPSNPFCLVSFFNVYDKRRLAKNTERVPGAWRYEAANLLTDILLDHHIEDEVFTFENHMILLHECAGESRAFSSAYLQSVRTIREMIGSTTQVRVGVCVSDVYRDFLSLKNGVADLERRSSCGFYHYDDLSLSPKEPDFQPMSYGVFNSYYKQFRTFVDDEAFAGQLETLCGEIEGRQYDPVMVRKLFHSFDSYLCRESVRIGGASHEIAMSDMAFAFCRDAVSLQYQWFQQQRRSPAALSTNEDINLVLRYIEENLDKKISLQTAAQYIYKNSNYLSRLFKQHMGATFTDYLIQMRIEKATELLEHSSLTAEEISQRIGIDNVSYFYQFYKRETGKTPRSGRPGGGSAS